MHVTGFKREKSLSGVIRLPIFPLVDDGFQLSVESIPNVVALIFYCDVM